MVISTSPLVKTYTLQEFWALPEPADRSTLELIKGVLYMSPPPDEAHDEIFGNLNRELQRALDRHGYGGTVYASRAALWIDDHTYLEPDLMYLSDELKAEMTPGRRTRADIVVEILSPRTALYDRTTKSDTYRAMGVRELWQIDGESAEVEVRSVEADKTAVYTIGDSIRSEVLPKIEIPVLALFPRLS
jgi:Uma2 family endonuclease